MSSRTTELSIEAKTALSRLCKELHAFFVNTEEKLNITKQAFNQIECISRPWVIKDTADSIKCTCNIPTNIEVVPQKDDEQLLNTITETLQKVQIIKKKCNIKSSSSKPSKTESIVEKKSSQVDKRKTSVPLHGPCCPLFDKKDSAGKKNEMTLREAIFRQKLPKEFVDLAEESKKIILGESKRKCIYRDMFTKKLEAKNEENCAKYKSEYPSIEGFLKFLSDAELSVKKHQKINSPWVFYDDPKQLLLSESLNLSFLKKSSWNNVLEVIIKYVIPNINQLDLDLEQKIYLFKILKTICNSTQTSTPTVPVFRIE